MLPMHGYHATGDSAYSSSFQAQKLIDSNFDTDSFVMQILNHRLQCTSSAHKTAVVYGAIPELKPIWERLFSCMAVAVSNLNRYMAKKTSYFVLHRVVDIMHTEVRKFCAARYAERIAKLTSSPQLSLSLPTWRAHAEGMGALVKTYGGIPELFKTKPPPAMSVQLVLM